MQPGELVIVVRRVRGLGFRATLPAGETVDAASVIELHDRVRGALDVPALRAEGVSSLRLEFTARRRNGLPGLWRKDVIALGG